MEMNLNSLRYGGISASKTDEASRMSWKQTRFFECTIPRNNDASDFKWSKLIYIYIYIHIIAGRDFSPPHWFVE